MRSATGRVGSVRTSTRHRRTARAAGSAAGRCGAYPRPMSPRSTSSAAARRASRSTAWRPFATSGSPSRDGLELSANLWLPEPAADGTGPRAVPGDPRDDPVPQGRLARGERREPRRVAGGARLRLLPARRPGHRARRRGSRSTSTRPARRRTATTPSSGSPRSRGAPARSGCGGSSYGGFTAIQVALLRPPHLAAIVPMMATDDRYTDDVHYLGGCVTVSELSQYAVSRWSG